MKRNWFVGLASLLLLAGCEHRNEPAPLTPEPRAFTLEGRIQFDDDDTKDKIKVVRVDPQRTPTGLLKLTVTFRNTTKHNRWCEVRTTFLDKDGHVLNRDQTNWEPFLIEAQTVNEYRVNSMSSDAADYQVIIRQPAKETLRRR